MTDWNKLRSMLNPPSTGTPALIDGYASMGSYGMGGSMPVDTAALQSLPGVTGATPGFMDQLQTAFMPENWFSKPGSGNTPGTIGTMNTLMNFGQGALNAYLGMKQYGLARDSFNQAKKEFEMNWGAQSKTINAQLEDRQRARVASNPGAYQSVPDYMKQNGIGG